MHKIIRGLCHYFSEQGMEGGVWALQEKFSLQFAQWGVWPNTTVWDAFDHKRKGVTKDSEVLKDGEWYPIPNPNRGIGVGFGDLTRSTVVWEDGIVERRVSNTILVLQWDYEFLHVLEDGDHLRIFDKDDPTKIAWEGTLSLEPTTTLYTPRSYQRGIEKAQWEKWFVDERYIGELVKKNPKK